MYPLGRLNRINGAFVVIQATKAASAGHPATNTASRLWFQGRSEFIAPGPAETRRNYRDEAAS
jgi:hypothetical protein